MGLLDYTQSSHLTTGFIRIPIQANIHNWVYQVVHSEPNIHLTDQSSQQMGLSYCTQSSYLTIGCTRITRQAIIHSWVYHTIHPKVTHKVKHNKTQPSQHMGLSSYHPIHLSSWVYQDSKEIGRKNY